MNRHRAGGPCAGQLHSLDFRRAAGYPLPRMVTTFAPGYIFLYFCGIMVFQLAWVKIILTETKGVPLEESQRKLATK